MNPSYNDIYHSLSYSLSYCVFVCHTASAADDVMSLLLQSLMQFAAFMRDEALERGADALATDMPFDQKAILEVHTYVHTSVH